MTDLQRDVLLMLRVFGPCSNFEVAQRLKERPRKTYRTMYVLTKAGFAVHQKSQQWDLSDKAREWFKAAPNEPPRLHYSES